MLSNAFHKNFLFVGVRNIVGFSCVTLDFTNNFYNEKWLKAFYYKNVAGRESATIGRWYSPPGTNSQ